MANVGEIVGKVTIGGLAIIGAGTVLVGIGTVVGDRVIDFVERVLTESGAVLGDDDLTDGTHSPDAELRQKAETVRRRMEEIKAQQAAEAKAKAAVQSVHQSIPGIERDELTEEELTGLGIPPFPE